MKKAISILLVAVMVFGAVPLAGFVGIELNLFTLNANAEESATSGYYTYPELLEPGEKVQIDVKEVPYNCLGGSVLRDEKHLYQWTAIDECTRMRFVYGFEEHTPENSVRFLAMLIKTFPFKIKTIQTDNGTEFTYKFISDDKNLSV